MTAPPSFPTLSGQDISLHKKPVFKTLVADHVSGREVRSALYQNPIWEFELTFNALDGASGGQYGFLGPESLQSLMGLYLACQGAYSTFLYADPTDSVVSNQSIGTGDGATTNFRFVRTLGAFTEPVGWVTGISSVSLNGINQASGWSLSAPNTLVFNSAPAADVSITASFTYAFQCRFSDDKLDFEQFAANLWKADSVKFQSVRAL